MKRNNWLTIFAFISLAGLLVIELGTRYDSWSRQVALSITNLIGGGVYLWIFLALKRRGVTLPWIAAWLVALGIWSDAAGNFAHLFRDILWWDKLAHFIGSIAPAAVFWIILYEFSKKEIIRIPVWLTNIFAVSLTALLAALYEISEFVGDQFFPTHRVTDLFDTADDLLWNFLGAMVAVVLCVLITKRKRKKELLKG